MYEDFDLDGSANNKVAEGVPREVSAKKEHNSNDENNHHA